MKLEYLICILSIFFSVTVFSQEKQLNINSVNFSVHQIKQDTLEGPKKEIVEFYREDKKLLSHIILEEEGDCSSIRIQLGKYQVIDDKITFYTYWATTDRMQSSVLTYGFWKQQYIVNNAGELELEESKIYLEDAVFTENKSFLVNNGWIHKGLSFLNQPIENKNDQKYLDDYIFNIENEYNGHFVLGKEKESLENEVRAILINEIDEYTKDWIEGEVYGNVKK